MPRNIAIFCDGTWQDESKNDATNVRKLKDAFDQATDKGNDDFCYYIKGVGTSGGRFARFFQGATGLGLSNDVKEGYKAICKYYKKGDRIFLIGYSRGSYTARSIAGLIGAVGIIDVRQYPEDLNLIRDLFQYDLDEVVDAVFEYYRDPPARRDVRDLRRIRRVDFDPMIQAVGVFDTVGALGIPIYDEDFAINRRFQFHDVTLGRGIRHAYHAVAIDEQRFPFRATLWEKQPETDDQILEQVWFPGDHGDVGGGKPAKASGLANIALWWMAEKLSGAGLPLDLNALHSSNPIDPSKPADTGMTPGWEAAGYYQRDVGYPGYSEQKIHTVYDWKLDPGNDANYAKIANPLKDYGEDLEKVAFPQIP